MLLENNLGKELWAEAINTAVYVINQTGKSRVNNRTPYEIWHNKELFDISKLRTFGAKVTVHIPQ